MITIISRSKGMRQCSASHPIDALLAGKSQRIDQRHVLLRVSGDGDGQVEESGRRHDGHSQQRQEIGARTVRRGGQRRGQRHHRTGRVCRPGRFPRRRLGTVQRRRQIGTRRPGRIRQSISSMLLAHSYYITSKGTQPCLGLLTCIIDLLSMSQNQFFAI